MSRSARPHDLDAQSLEELARQARESQGLKAKAEIGAVAKRLGLRRSQIPV